MRSQNSTYKQRNVNYKPQLNIKTHSLRLLQIQLATFFVKNGLDCLINAIFPSNQPNWESLRGMENRLYRWFVWVRFVCSCKGFFVSKKAKTQATKVSLGLNRKQYHEKQ